MDKKVLKRLEFHKVLEQLASYAVSPWEKSGQWSWSRLMTWGQ